MSSKPATLESQRDEIAALPSRSSSSIDQTGSHIDNSLHPNFLDVAIFDSLAQAALPFVKGIDVAVENALVCLNHSTRAVESLHSPGRPYGIDNGSMLATA